MADVMLRPAARWLLRGVTGAGMFGDYASFAEAQQHASPYRSNLSHLCALADNIRNDRAADRISSTMLAALLLPDEPLRVLDFGGSIGITYFLAQRAIMDRIARWHIVDLPDVVSCGRERYADDRLQFFSSIAAATADFIPNVILCGGVLQYLEDPYGAIEVLAGLQPAVIALDRTPIYPDRERFMVQHIWPHLGGGKSAWRVLSECKLADALSDYTVVSEQLLPLAETEARGSAYVARIYTLKSEAL